jgi:hypothetical protein
MEITRLPDIQPDRDRSKPPPSRRQRGRPGRKVPPAEAVPTPEAVEETPEPPTAPPRRVDVTA